MKGINLIAPLLTGLFIALAAPNAIAQDCAAFQKEVIVQIVADDFPNETSWEIADAAGNVLAQGLTEGDTVCVDIESCIIFTIYDSYGDGICCGYGLGSYAVSYDGQTVASGGDFNYSEATAFNCPPGFTCTNAMAVIPGWHSAPNNDFWYSYTPDSTGIYTVSTCDSNTCDTKIWIYDDCTGLLISEDNAGTIYYSDNEGGCGDQAVVSAYLETGVDYYLRIGSAMASCQDPILWSLSYGGEITGCTDSLSCNYNPLANADDGSCIYPGNPNCSGPDLWVLESALLNSLHTDVINNNNDNCLINEGCVQGFGMRELVRFTTHIKNIGDLDYYIGRPSDNPDQFSFDNCHGHYHYEGYAEYRLVNEDNQLMPTGFKNGFCVLDLECEDGGTPKFGCGNMGISAGCGDYYSSGLQCQWVDVTELDTGKYTLVVTTNWDRSPDALGRYELSYENNWAQVCFYLSRNAQGHQITLLPDCEVVVDCEGTPFGDVVEDCMGICGGAALYGDVNGDLNQDNADALDYIFDIIHGGLEASTCLDLDANGVISVYDASLINSCYLYGSGHDHPSGGNIHNHCNLPGGIINNSHTASLAIIDADFENNTIDIGINNPSDHITAYEFNMSGMAIESVISLVDPLRFPVEPDYVIGGNKVIGISLADSSISKTNGTYQPLCRISFSSTEGSQICIDTIIDIVNDLTHKVNTDIENGCTDIISATNDHLARHNLFLFPNPSDGPVLLNYKLPYTSAITIEVNNNLGQLVMKELLPTSQQGSFELDLSAEKPGVYFIRFATPQGVSTRKIVIER